MSKLHIVLFLLVMIILPISVQAGETPWASTDHARMRLLTGVNSIGEAGQFEAALHMNMSEGWHSYWRVPGDAGAPPRFNWEGSENVESVDVSWQAPGRYEEYEFQTFGYSGDVYFPLVVNLKEPNKATTLKVNIQTMVCSDICIPQFFDLSMTIPAGDGKRVAEQRIINFEKRRVPKTENTKNLKIETIVTGPDALVVSAYSNNGFKDADIFAYAPDFPLTAIPETTLDKADNRRAIIKIPKPMDIENLSEELAGQEINITLVNGRDAIERTFTP